MPNALKELGRFGQSPWLDTIGRGLLRSGELARLIREDGLKGVTSNPTIFAGALSSGADYDEPLATHLAAGESDPERLYECLAFDDIRGAADLLRPVFESSRGADGFVSLEVSPALAYDAPGTLAAARRHSPDLALVDLGARQSFPLFDHFLAADKAVLTLVPEPTAVENTYEFLKSLFFRFFKLDHLIQLVQFGLLDIDKCVQSVQDAQTKTVLGHLRTLTGQILCNRGGFLVPFEGVIHFVTA